MTHCLVSIRRLFLALTLVLLTAPAQAAFIALDSTRLTGNQAWPGALGMDFNVLTPIVVTHLGAYDSGGNGFLGPGAGISVGIFNRNTATLVGTAALLTGTAQPLGGSGRNRFFDILDFVLPVGNYSIVAQGFDDIDLNGNTGLGGAGPTIDTGGGLISFVGSARFTGTTALVFPTTVDGGPANRYDAGTFQFTAVPAAAPEPGGLALGALGLLALSLMRSRRS